MHLRHGLGAVIAMSAIVVLAGLASSLPNAATAGQGLVTVRVVSSGGDFVRTQPHVAYDALHDRYLFVWRDKRNDAEGNRLDERCDYRKTDPLCWPNADVYARLVSGAGEPVGDEIHIAGDLPNMPRDQQWPFVVFNPTSGEYLTAWQEVSPLAEPNGGNSNWYRYCYDIVAQRLDAGGNLVSAPITVSDAIDCQWVPIISHDRQSGGYLVTWHDHRYRSWNPPRVYATEKEIFAQWLAYSNGGLFLDGANFLITTDFAMPSAPAPDNQQYSTIAYDSQTQQHAILWSDARGVHQDIYHQELPSGCSQAVNNRVVNPSPNVDEKPRAAYNARSGETWAVWQSYAMGQDQELVPYSVQAARLAPGGDRVGDVVTVASGHLATWRAHYLLPDVACSGETGNCLVVWHDGGPHYRLLDRHGIPVGQGQTLLASEDYHTNPRVIATESQRGPEFVITFNHAGNIYYAVAPDTGPAPTATPTATPSATPTPTVTPTATPQGEPDLSTSSKSVTPEVIGRYEQATFTITLRNQGSASADVRLSDTPPLSYVASSATGGMQWDDTAGRLKWQGTLAAGESRVFTYRVYGPSIALLQDTDYENRAIVEDGIHPPLLLTASVLVRAAPTSTPTPIATATTTPMRIYLPLVRR